MSLSGAVRLSAERRHLPAKVATMRKPRTSLRSLLAKSINLWKGVRK
jgi:hypothetical protein